MKNYSRRYILLILSLIVFGTLMVFSTSWPYSYRRYGSETLIFNKQIGLAITSVIVMCLVSFIDVKKLEKYSYSIFLFTFFMCFLVYIPHLGLDSNGAKRWILLWKITLMPSDFLKIGAVFMMSYIIDKYRNKFNFKTIFKKYFLISVVVVIGVMIQPDLSTTFIIVSTITAMYIVAGMDKKAGFIAMLILTISTISGIIFLKSSYSRTSRLQAFLNPLKYRDDQSWQLIKSLFAISNGSLLGVGLGNGRQKLTLSEAHNDFIFATIAEEFGFIGSLILISAFIYLSYLGIKIANSANTLYEKMVVMGITFLIGLQAIVNIGTATGIVPPTGVTLPFVSYGGSSLIMTSVMAGIVLSVARKAQKRR